MPSMAIQNAWRPSRIPTFLAIHDFGSEVGIVWAHNETAILSIRHDALAW
jgi:hypothetical protein